jgi:WD40 repeat protein
MNIRTFFADDIFISYARRDSSTYAAGLADELTKHGFSCFIDRLGTEANAELPQTLRSKIRSCTMLVVVGTKWSGSRDSIKDEIAEFNKTKRPIIPIDIDGSIYDAVWYKLIEGIAPEPEKNPDALDDGDPSPAVVSRIEKAFKYKRRNERLFRWTVGTAGVLALLIAVSVAASFKAASELARANSASVEAEKQTKAAVDSKIEAEKAKGEAESAKSEAERAKRDASQAKEDANLARSEAERAQIVASEQQRLADLATRRANEARADAEKQQAIAVGRQTATVADSRRARSVRLEARWADMFQHSALLSLEANKRLSRLGIAPAESDQSLRDSLNLLPRSVKQFDHQHEIREALLTPDGKYLIANEADRFIRVWDTTNHTPVSPEIQLGRQVTFNSDRTAVAMIEKDGRLVVHKLPQGNLLWNRDQSNRYRFLQFSADGRFLAADVYSPASEETANQSHRMVLWDARSGEQFTEFKYDGDLIGTAFSPVDNKLALSLTRPAKLPDGSTSEAEEEKDNFVQIWKIKNPVSSLLEEKQVAPKDKTTGCDRVAVYQPLSNLTYSPDGRFLAASTGFHATILDSSSWEEVAYIAGPNQDPVQTRECSITEELRRLQFSPDGKSLGTVGKKGTMQTWDVLTGKQLWYEFREDALIAMWEPRYIVVGTSGGVRLVDVRTGNEVARVLQTIDADLGDYAAETDRLVLFKGNKIWMYEIGSAQEIARIAYKRTADIRKTNSTPDGRFVALTDETLVIVWDAITARQVARLQHDSAVYRDVAFSHDGSLIATATWDNVVHIWAINGEREIGRIKDLPVTAIDDFDERHWNVDLLYFSPRGKFLVLEESTLMVFSNRTIRVLEVSSQREMAMGEHYESSNFDYAPKVRFTPDDKFMTLPARNAVRVIDTENNQPVAMLPRVKDAGPMVVSRDRIAVSREGDVDVFDLRGNLKYSVKLGGKKASYNFTPDGNYLVVIGGEDLRDGHISEVATGRPKAIVKLEQTNNSLRFSPSGRYLVTISQVGKEKVPGDVTVWELSTGRKVARATGEEIVSTVVFSPDEQNVILGGFKSSTVRVLNLMTGSIDAELFNDGFVRDAIFSKDGRFFATTSGDRARVWEMGTWREIARLSHEGNIISARFVDNHDYLATVSADLTARVWILREEELVTRACERLTRNLNAEEWETSFGREKYSATCPNLPASRQMNEENRE